MLVMKFFFYLAFLVPVLPYSIFILYSIIDHYIFIQCFNCYYFPLFRLFQTHCCDKGISGYSIILLKSINSPTENQFCFVNLHHSLLLFQSCDYVYKLFTIFTPKICTFASKRGINLNLLMYFQCFCFAFFRFNHIHRMAGLWRTYSRFVERFPWGANILQTGTVGCVFLAEFCQFRICGIRKKSANFIC